MIEQSDKELARDIGRIIARVRHRIATSEWQKKNRARRAESRRAWYLRNSEKAKAASARYRAKYPEKVKAQRKAWAVKNPKHHAIWSAAKRAKLRQLSVSPASSKSSLSQEAPSR